MTATPAGQDSPDWTTNQGASGAAILNEQVVINNGTVLPITYVGGWKQLLVQAEILGPSANRWALIFQWCDSATALAGYMGTTVEVPVAPGNATVALPVMGPFVRIVAQRLTGAGTDTCQLEVVATAQSIPGYPGTHGQPLIDVNGTVLPGAGTLTVSPTTVVNGVATLTVLGNDANWYAILHKLTAAGALGAPLAFIDPGVARGGMARFGLPPVQCTLEVVNKAAPANAVYATMNLDWQ